jgi:hypothetical protein
MNDNDLELCKEEVLPEQIQNLQIYTSSCESQCGNISLMIRGAPFTSLWSAHKLVGTVPLNFQWTSHESW